MRLNRADELKALEIAAKRGLSLNEVKAMIISQYEFIREKTKEIDIPDDTTEEEFDKIKTNFNIPCLAKLHASYYIWRRIIENKNKNNGDKK